MLGPGSVDAGDLFWLDPHAGVQGPDGSLVYITKQRASSAFDVSKMNITHVQQTL